MEIANGDARVRLYHSLADLFRLLQNPKSIRILQHLLVEPKRFQNLVYDLRMPSNILAKHLKSLQKFGMVNKTAKEDPYQITEIGKTALDVSLDDISAENIFQIMRKALDLAHEPEKGKPTSQR